MTFQKMNESPEHHLFTHLVAGLAGAFEGQKRLSQLTMVPRSQESGASVGIEI